MSSRDDRPEVRLRLTPTGGGSTVQVNGVDVSGLVRAVTVATAVGEPTRVWLEYACMRVDVDGHPVSVEHVCPLGPPDSGNRDTEGED